MLSCNGDSGWQPSEPICHDSEMRRPTIFVLVLLALVAVACSDGNDVESGGTTTTIDVSVTSQTETFALVFTIQINVPTTGDYEFFTNSDDGSILYIDGSVVVDNDGLHGPASVANSTTLTAGLHDLRVEFFEKGGGEVLGSFADD